MEEKRYQRIKERQRHLLESIKKMIKAQSSTLLLMALFRRKDYYVQN